jgi:hypothetical protein
MAEAQFPINNNITKIIENKIKSLEARLNGPNSHGNMPIEINNNSSIKEIEAEALIKSSKLKFFEIYILIKFFIIFIFQKFQIV